MAITPDKSIFKTLDEFFAKMTMQSVNRDAYLVCNLHDKVNKVIVSFVFIRDWDGIEYNKYDEEIIPNKGAVFTFPSYWVSLPKELIFDKFAAIVNKFYEEYVSAWVGSSSSGNSGSIGGNINNGGNLNGCVCCPPCNLI